MRRLNKGFNLIELMISILVASIIVAGLYSLMTSSVVNFGISKGSAVAGASVRRVDSTFNDLLFQTGYMNYQRITNFALFQARTNTHNNLFENWGAEQVVRVKYENSADSNYSDMLKIRFYGSSVSDNMSDGKGTDADGYIFDCQGQPLNNDVEMELIFYVRKGQGLLCRQLAIGGKNPVDVVIDPNVINMRVQVGTSVGGAVGQTGAESAFYRVNGNALSPVTGSGTPPSWSEINLLRYALVVSVPSGQKLVKRGAEFTLFPDDAHSPKYQVLKDDADAVNVHRIISGNVQFINRL